MRNIHEIQIKDERGKLRICSTIDSQANFCVRVWHTPPRKRTESINWTIATEEEKLRCLTELWEKMKPTEIKYY